MQLQAARRRKNLIIMSLSAGFTLLGLGVLALILLTLLREGLSGLSVAVFAQMTPPPASWKGSGP